MGIDPIDRFRRALDDHEPTTTDQLRKPWGELFDDIVMPEVYRARDAGDVERAFAILTAAWEHAIAVGAIDRLPTLMEPDDYFKMDR